MHPINVVQIALKIFRFVPFLVIDNDIKHVSSVTFMYIYSQCQFGNLVLDSYTQNVLYIDILNIGQTYFSNNDTHIQHQILINANIIQFNLLIRNNISENAHNMFYFTI